MTSFAASECEFYATPSDRKIYFTIHIYIFYTFILLPHPYLYGCIQLVVIDIQMIGIRGINRECNAGPSMFTFLVRIMLMPIDPLYTGTPYHHMYSLTIVRP